MPYSNPPSRRWQSPTPPIPPPHPIRFRAGDYSCRCAVSAVCPKRKGPPMLPRSTGRPFMLNVALIVLAAAILCCAAAYLTRPRAFTPRRRRRSRP